VKVAIGFDHGGVLLRDAVVVILRELGHEIEDFGTAGTDSVDYPDYAAQVANAVVSGQCERGVLACGTGIGMSIAANKVPGCYAAVLADCFSARMAAEHNAANVACLGGRVTGPELAQAILKAYLQAVPDGSGRHQQRRDKICRLERE
jgi:ribose 5-phosphate isomerase B